MISLAAFHNGAVPKDALRGTTYVDYITSGKEKATKEMDRIVVMKLEIEHILGKSRRPH